MSTKMPKGKIFETFPDTKSPLLNSAAVGLEETESLCRSGLHSVIVNPVTSSPSLNSLAAFGSCDVAHRASRWAPTSTKIPNCVTLETFPETLLPTGKLARDVTGLLATASNPSRVMTSKIPSARSSFMTMRSFNSSPTLKSDKLLSPRDLMRSSACCESPTSMKMPSVSLIETTFPDTVWPRITVSSNIVVTLTRAPSTLMTFKSATSPLVYLSTCLLNPPAVARTSEERPTLKNTPNCVTSLTVPSKVSPTSTSEVKRRLVTSTNFFSTFTDTILRPSTFSPAV
mmetsp:Transcript_105879/g.210455  ORF Transcript_105879/g.210455 Transcript_105879/m.210455 type:complete len:286 (+) Transcript_105879:918-1775(+)